MERRKQPLSPENVEYFQLLKSEDLMLFFVLSDKNLNMLEI